MRARISFVIALVWGLALPLYARAECPVTPVGCYCQGVTAAAQATVVSVHEDASKGDRIRVRVDEILAGDATQARVEVGQVFELDASGFYPEFLDVGDRVLVPLDDERSFGSQQFELDLEGNTDCGDTVVAAPDAAELLVQDIQECRRTIESRGWVAPCDDERGCQFATAGGGKDHGPLTGMVPLGFLLAGVVWLALRSRMAGRGGVRAQGPPPPGPNRRAQSRRGA